MKSIILLTGPVGAGKTTVAKELVALSPAPVVYIEGDQFWFFIAKSEEGKGRFKSFKTVMASMTAAALPFALADYEVILDFSIPPWFLPTVQRITSRRDVPIDFVVIRPSLETCAKRAKDRKEGKIEDYAQYRELYADFDGWERHMIADDEDDAASIAQRIRMSVDDGDFRLHDADAEQADS